MAEKFLLLKSGVSRAALLPLVTAAKSFLRLYLPEREVEESDFISDFGYWGRVAFLDPTLETYALWYAKAAASGSRLLALEEDSYLNALYVKRFLLEHSAHHERVASWLKREHGLDLVLTHSPRYLPHLLAEVSERRKKLAQATSPLLRTGWFFSPRHHELPRSEERAWCENLCAALKLTPPPRTQTFPSDGYAALMPFNQALAIEEMSKLYFERVDEGVLLMVATSAAQCGFYARAQGLIERHAHRGKLSVPVLYPVQVFLLAEHACSFDEMGLDTSSVWAALADVFS